MGTAFYGWMEQSLPTMAPLNLVLINTWRMSPSLNWQLSSNFPPHLSLPFPANPLPQTTGPMASRGTSFRISCFKVRSQLIFFSHLYFFFSVCSPCVKPVSSVLSTGCANRGTQREHKRGSQWKTSDSPGLYFHYVKKLWLGRFSEFRLGSRINWFGNN